MRYVTTYDIGKRKREQDGINEDGVAITVFQDGHRSGYVPASDDADVEPQDETEDAEVAHGPGDAVADESTTDDDGVSVDDTEVFDVDATGDDSDEAGLPTDRTVGLVVLADGAGGEQAGDVASYIATTTISAELAPLLGQIAQRRPGEFGLEMSPEVFGDPLSGEAIRKRIAEAITTAHREIIRYATETGQEGMYTTVVAGVAAGDQFHYGWVGDSRAYVVNESHEQIAELTRDHAKVQRYEDEGKIDEVEAHVHPDGNQITRAVGGGGNNDSETARVEVDTDSVPLYADDTVLLTSDGLIDAQTDARELYNEYKIADDTDAAAEYVLEKVVTNDDIRDIVLEAESLDAAASELITFSNEKGGKDNISIVLFEDETLPASPDPEVSGIPERAHDPDEPLEDRETVIEP